MATTGEHRTIAPIVGPDDPRRFTDSGIEVKQRYDDSDLPEDLQQRLGEPGQFPYTRGIHPDMYRRQLWTMRQYAGYASAKESNERYRYLLEHGSTGLSMASRCSSIARRAATTARCCGPPSDAASSCTAGSSLSARRPVSLRRSTPLPPSSRLALVP